MTRVRLAAAALAVLGLAAGGCGGGDAPSRAEFAKRIEKICNDTQRRIQSVGARATSRQDVADAVDEVIDQSRRSVDDLKALDLPGGDAHDTAKKFVDAWSKVADEGVPALEDLRDALKQSDRRAAQRTARDAARRLQAIETGDVNRYARALGADDCAQ
jgi:hypothetical protein